MGNWTLDDIPWDSFDPSRVDPGVIPIIKAASLVEYNAEDYRAYLNRVFEGDSRLQAAIDSWAEEEIQHGRALGRWAALADPEFDFETRFSRFRNNFRLQLDANVSVRGTRAGELVARCMVETGTNSFYSALADATDEPVLRSICRRIADDEYAHYCLFHRNMRRYVTHDRLSRLKRIRVAFGRMSESEDDELASAYWAANNDGRAYDRRANAAAYARRALRYYRPQHVARGVEMIFDAVGIDGRSTTGRLAAGAVRLFVWYRLRVATRLLVALVEARRRLARPGAAPQRA